MKDCSKFSKNENTKKKFESYSLDRQDAIIDRINRERFKKMEKHLEWCSEDHEKNPHKYYVL